MAEEEGGFLVFDVMLENNHLLGRHKENDIRESGVDVFSLSQSCFDLAKRNQIQSNSINLFKQNLDDAGNICGRSAGLGKT